MIKQLSVYSFIVKSLNALFFFLYNSALAEIELRNVFVCLYLNFTVIHSIVINLTLDNLAPLNTSRTQCLIRMPLFASPRLTGIGVMVRARVLNCVDGVNIALLQKAINEQRSFFRERECKQGKPA